MSWFAEAWWKVQRAMAPKPEEVFTPFDGKVNSAVLVRRKTPETDLRMALRTGRHVLLHGPSGSGKTVLFRTVLRDEGYEYLEVNLHQQGMSPGRSIDDALWDILAQSVRLVEGDEKLAGEASAPLGPVAFKVSGEKAYKRIPRRAFQVAANEIHERSERNGTKPGFIILDNMEAIADSNDRLLELGSLVMAMSKLADQGDGNSGVGAVRLLIVGTRDDVRKYYDSLPAMSPVLRRIEELPAIGHLSAEEARELIRKGFFGTLRYRFRPVPWFDDESKLVERVVEVTDRHPFDVQDLCLRIAFCAEQSNGRLSVNEMTEGEVLWLRAVANTVGRTIERLTVGDGEASEVRKMVIWAVGTMPASDFDAAMVEAFVRRDFLLKPNDKRLKRIGDHLADLASARPDEPALVKAAHRVGYYTLVDRRSKSLIRVMFEITDGRDGEMRIVDVDYVAKWAR